jgi:hypothetical protein
LTTIPASDKVDHSSEKMALFKRKGGGEAGGAGDFMLEGARKIIDPNLSGARFLVTTEPFGRDEMQKYINLTEESTGSPSEPGKKAMLLNSGEGILGGYEAVRQQLLAVHMEGIQVGIRLLRESESAGPAAQYLLSVMKEIDSIQRQAARP